jgi:transposase
MKHRHELTDEQWARLAPLLPPQKPKRGRPARDHRQLVNAMLWIHATGAPWRDLPERYGPWQSVATRFYRWVAAGLWDTILAALQQQGDAAGQLDWSAHFVDGAVIRAHQHAAGARRAKGGLLSRRSARAAAASAPSSTCGPSAAASPSLCS